MSARNVHRQHPAEASAASIGVVIVALEQLTGLSLTTEQLQALIVLLGFLPAVVTFIVTKRRSA